ncbi:uncharacterized protein CTRU02_208083 [Colletotrichum truncatum]|uniref:Uncharacterized protein n=1 Tax=Colletotrichum truncatum TaxID=5467 RepID=A0ACC3YVC2_COLTU
MKFTAATILAAVGLVAAQIGDIPACAATCLAQAFSSSTACQPGDFACLCNPATYQALITSITPCVVSSCGETVATSRSFRVILNEFTQVRPAADRLCAAVAGGGGAASGSSAPSAASGASAGPGATAAGAGTGVTQAPASSAAGQRTTRTVAVTNVVTRNGSVIATATSTVVPVTVNGASVQAPVGVLAMLAIGALAAL